MVTVANHRSPLPLPQWRQKMPKRRFVVIIEEETPEEISSFGKYLEERDFGWWHWVSNVWLLTVHNEQLSAVEIRDELRKITRDKVTMVIEVNSVTWAGFGPTTGEKDISKWMIDIWSKQ